jgi:hypothetical protein
MEQSAAVTVSTKMEQSCITIQVSEIDLWRVAQMLVANYGDAAEQEASARADRCYVEAVDDDNVEAKIWDLIAVRVRDLQHGKPGIYLH